MVTAAQRRRQTVRQEWIRTMQRRAAVSSSAATRLLHSQLDSDGRLCALLLTPADAEYAFVRAKVEACNGR